jgi:IQ calmodulin-binding motif
LGEKSTKAAISIQSVTRRKFERDKFENLRDAAVRVQKHQRMRYARNLMNSRKRQHLLALASFQAIVRAKLARCLFAQQKSAANVMQRAFFTWKMNVTLLEVQSSVVLLKRSIRGQLERSATRFALSHVNDSRRSFDRISTLSFHVDSSILAAWSEAESMAKECAAVVIQGAVRRYIAIVHIREMVDKSHGQKINSKIGARWRIILLRQDANATVIQSRFRAFRKRHQLSLENFHAAATLLQATYRCHWHRREFFRAQTSAIKLQYHFRALLSRMSAPPVYTDAGQSVAAALIQASVRGYQCRMHYHSSVESVRVIQSYWRRHVHSTRKRKVLASAIRIQKWSKAVKRRLMERKELALATARGVHFVEEAILLEMERKARDQVGLLLLKPRRVRKTSACVRRLAKRVKSLSEDCKENRTHGESNNAGLFTVYEQDVYASAPM